jgi:phosphoribosylformimino-5-aminoimidazole carboxamide ribotide isomerase
MLIIPAIDIMGGKVVRLMQGDFQKVTLYDLSPLVYAEKWVSEGARFIHVVDLDGAKSGEPKNLEVIRDLKKATNVALEVGGGIRSADTIKRYLKMGIERVVLSTKIIEDASFLLSREIKEYLKNVAVSIDIRQMTTREIVTTGTNAWFQSGDMLLDIPSFIQTVVTAGVEYINFSDITKDGMMMGPDTDKILSFLKIARESVKTKLFFTYAGGISSLEDIWTLKSLGQMGVDAVVVGRALYENKFSFKDALKAAS